MSLQLLMLHHFSFSLLGNAYAAPSCILAALWSRRRCAGEAQPTLCSHLHSSTDLYSIDEVAAQDKEGAIGSRQLSYDASREGFTWGHKSSSELCKERKCFCVLVNVVQQRICVWLPSLVKAQWRTCWGCAGRIGTPPWLQSAVGCKKGFYGCTSQMVWHGNETSIMKKFTHRTKS